ncbi:tripartite tricarboxylate transporter TctB family protein [Palleronia abyssalis]|uniref:DUF1468 domain-containing protein n=1 Tax=Palleronia abyssalis TaxID=1501240 RepID=A0A2R8BR29_9RHOB|nr:tripartite tricarboxylate transporter TctB family protein [Palleronia abyssalis]SPJ22591.1 hypothetical protein PAA8504_00386 [Palleronia abyssalis]
MRRDWPDIWGGLVLAALGAAALGWTLVHYDLGSLRRMGPGFFPATLGALLAVLGLVVALPAWRRTGASVPVHPLAALAVLASVVIFGLGLSRLGLVAATALSVLIATLPAPFAGWGWRIALTVIVPALTVVIFSFGLQMTLPLWPRLP